MNRPLFLRAAAVSLLTLGITSLGVQAAFADDLPVTETAAVSAPAAPAAEPDAPAAAPEDTTGETAPAEAAPAPVEPASTEGASTEGASSEVASSEAATSDTAEPVTAAAAEENAEPEVDPTPYKLIAWKLPCGKQDPFCAPGQTLGYVLDVSEPTLDALDDQIAGTCTDWQLDLYYDSPTTDALIAAGVLTAANHPTEDHAYGVLPDGESPFKLVDNEDCAVGGSVVPIATATAQTCDVNSQLINGNIQVVQMTGVTYTIAGPSGSVPFDPTTGVTGRVAPGAYSVTYALDPTFTSTVPNPIALTVAASPTACTTTTPPTTPPTTTTTTPSDPKTAVLGDPTQLTTLALTGSDPFAAASVASGLLLVGILVLTLRAVYARTRPQTSR